MVFAKIKQDLKLFKFCEIVASIKGFPCFGMDICTIKKTIVEK